MAREDDGDSCVRPFAEHARHHVDGDRIEPGERFVEHEHVRPEDECCGQLDPLLVAQAEGLQLGVAPVGETEPVQPAERGLPGFRARHAVQLAEVGELLRHVHLGIQAAFLGHVADAAPGLERQGYAQPAHHAGIRREHAQRDPHRRRLAGAVAPHEAEQLAGADLEGEVLDGDDVAVALRRCQKHGNDGRACSSLRLARDLESVTFIERDAPGIRGVEIHRQMILVDDREAMLHQFAAEAPSLHGRVDAEPCQVPMRESRVCVIHLAEHGKGVLVLCGRDGLREHGDDGVAVHVHTRRQP